MQRRVPRPACCRSRSSVEFLHVALDDVHADAAARCRLTVARWSRSRLGTPAAGTPRAIAFAASIRPESMALRADAPASRLRPFGIRSRCCCLWLGDQRMSALVCRRRVASGGVYAVLIGGSGASTARRCAAPADASPLVELPVSPPPTRCRTCFAAGRRARSRTAGAGKRPERAAGSGSCASLITRSRSLRGVARRERRRRPRAAARASA